MPRKTLLPLQAAAEFICALLLVSVCFWALEESGLTLLEARFGKERFPFSFVALHLVSFSSL